MKKPPARCLLLLLPSCQLFSLTMVRAPLAERLEEAGRAARAAEARHDQAGAAEAWRRYRLIRDAARDPDELLAEGIALSDQAARLAASGQ